MFCAYPCYKYIARFSIGLLALKCNPSALNFSKPVPFFDIWSVCLLLKCISLFVESWATFICHGDATHHDWHFSSRCLYLNFVKAETILCSFSWFLVCCCTFNILASMLKSLLLRSVCFDCRSTIFMVNSSVNLFISLNSGSQYSPDMIDMCSTSRSVKTSWFVPCVVWLCICLMSMHRVFAGSILHFFFISVIWHSPSIRFSCSANSVSSFVVNFSG